MKNLFLTFVFSILILSCSSDDDSNQTNEQTFLEAFNGKGFECCDSDEYIYFYNTTTNFLKFIEYDDYGSDCYSFSIGNAIDEEGDSYKLTINVNTSTKLNFTITYSNDSTGDTYDIVKLNDSSISVDGTTYMLTSEPYSCN
jgi:hypothetical protein